MRIAGRIASVIAAITLVFVAIVGTAGFLDIKNPFRTRSIDRSQPALLKSIQDISQFHAAVGNFEVVLDYEQDVDWVPSFIAGERSLFVAAGTVNAYVDFSGLTAGDLRLSEDGKSVEIRLPAAELDEPNLDQDRTYLFSQDRGVVNRVGDALSTDDQQELYQLAEQKLVSAAEESVLTQQAEKNTRAMLVGLFDSLEIQVTFAEGALKE
ncbi:DUF4230 domain-containing protein [Nocardioides guangzhouensis]|uniref:DUF4230 domain-containing protein n=1 Tax=Nocardioides guangzhouensis TaxID=2497878 RepID=A0A4V1XZV9_9ACTN|nr:DUF4230 domain-containing protein [Nocardioides guangzhouensis]RYP88109.1 DUF4230 domain-containing protein [Nocardioides guangzhouensis]